MKYESSEISIDQLARLARDAGVSAQQEISDKLQERLLACEANDKGMYSSNRGVVSQVLELIRFY